MRDKGEVLLTIFILALIPLTIFLYARNADAHTAKIHVKVQLSQDQCPGSEEGSGILGCEFEGPRGVWNVFWSDNDELTLRHELGHVFSATEMATTDRAAFMSIFGFKVWEGLAEEWFAEGYARCGRHISPNVLGAYSYQPLKWQHRAVCRTIWNADRVRGR